MEDIVLLDVIERYLTGQMPPEEKKWFKELREKNPEIDQLVVEHKLFLQQFEGFGEHAALKHTIAAAHNSLLQKGDINEGGQQSARGRIVQMFHKYKKVTGIAASIAGITALAISVLVASLSPKADPNQVIKLNGDIKNIKAELNNIKNEKNEASHHETEAPISTGTAFLIDGRGYLITNAHVLKGLSAQVVDRNGNEYNTRILKIDDKKDLAILKISDDDFKAIPSLPYGVKKSNVALGEELFTLGYPRDEISYSLGYLSAESGKNGDTASCQISLPANPGNSGSPVFNKNGDIVGVLTSKDPTADGVVFVVKAKGIYQMIDELKESDTAIQKIKVSNNTYLKGEARPEQISKVKDYVFFVKAYNK